MYINLLEKQNFYFKIISGMHKSQAYLYIEGRLFEIYAVLTNSLRSPRLLSGILHSRTGISQVTAYLNEEAAISIRKY